MSDEPAADLDAGGPEPTILHVDLDAFFASVEQLADPSLQGRPVVVGGLGPRGVVAAASYEARRFGVYSATPMARARRACPDAVFLAPRLDAYAAASAEVMGILESVTPLVEPISMDDVLGSRVISSPLHLLDCCLVSDGGAAVVVSARDAARGGPNGQVSVLGAGRGHTHEHIMCAPSLTDFGCKASSRLAFERAGVTPRDIDVAAIYDSFTITLLVELESIGFFAPGEAGPAALAGELGLSGSLPCNTHGGLLSYGHSGAAGGMFHVIEAVRQLRGTAEGRQVDGAELAFVHGDGGILSAHCSLVLGRG